jgi:hypothetical protein
VNLALSPRRADTYLEVLVQNVSSAAMVFERVVLEPVPGMQSRNIGRSEAAAAGVLPEDECAEVDGSDSAPSMLPGDTTQRLFLLSPTDEGAEVPALEGPQGHLLKDLPLSSFPPHYAPGTALPLGWLDISWVSGPYREHGRFRTLPLRRRAPAVPLINTSRPGTPTARPMSVSMTTQAGSTRHSMLPRWEFDLVLDTERSVPIEEEFTATLKLAVRSAPVLSDDAAPPPPPPLQLGVQVLYRPPPPPLTAPAVTIRAPSRTVTPSAGAARPQSPTASLRSLSRPMTPVSQQLRHAAVTSLASPTSTPSLTPPPPLSAAPLTPAAAFPPAPLGVPAGKRGIAPPPPGRVAALGTSLVLPPPGAWCLVRDRAGTAYAAEAPGTTVYRRWEVTYDVPIRFLALAGGLADLGGLRVVVMDEGSVGREWESLGDVWVTDD